MKGETFQRGSRSWRLPVAAQRREDGGGRALVVALHGLSGANMPESD